MQQQILETLQQTAANPFLFYAAVWLVCGLGAVVYLPVEGVLAAIVLMMPEKSPLGVTAAISLSSPIAFSAHYLIGRGAFSLSGRLRKAAKKLDPKRFQKSTFTALFMAASASLPPFVPACVLSGMLGIKYRSFFFPALAGRTLRFCVVTLILLSAEQASGPVGEWIAGFKDSLLGP